MRYLNIINKENKKLFGIIALLLLIVTGVSYAMFVETKSNAKNQIIKTGTLQIEYSSKNGYIDNGNYKGLIPKSNDEALSEDGYEFSVRNTGTLTSTYNVYLYINTLDYENDKVTGKISGDLFTNLNYLKYNIKTNNDNNNDIKIIGNQLKRNEDGIDKYLLQQFTVNANNEINNHVLRLWLSEDTDVGEINKYVYLKLEVDNYISGQESR